MENHFERRNVSDRERNGTFKRGHKKRGGRKRGTPNAMSPEFKQLLLEVAEQHGSDSRGTDGLQGYMSFLAVKYPRAFCRLLGKLL